MVEQVADKEKSLEEILALTLETIRPVLRGDKRKTKIFKDGEDPEFYPVSGVGPKTAREVVERLAKKLGADLTTGKEISYEPTDISGSMARAIYHYPTKRFTNIFITAELIKPWDAGYYQVATWGIENLHPKTEFQKIKERVQEIFGVREQYIQA